MVSRCRVGPSGAAPPSTTATASASAATSSPSKSTRPDGGPALTPHARIAHGSLVDRTSGRSHTDGMKTRQYLKPIIAGALLSGGLAMAGVGLVVGTAHADLAPIVRQDGGTRRSPTNSCTYQWCPGSTVSLNMPNLDRNTCHPWYFDPNSPETNSTIIEGFPPP